MELSLNDIIEVKREFSEMKGKFEEMYSALIGNKIAGDGGLIKQILDNKISIDELELKIQALEKRNNKSEIYIKIIWGMAGCIIATIYTYIIRIVFHV